LELFQHDKFLKEFQLSLMKHVASKMCASEAERLQEDQQYS